MANENKQALVTAIWENPRPAFGCDFTNGNGYRSNLKGGEYNEKGKIRINLTSDGGNIIVHYNGSSRREHTDVFTYLGEHVLNTRDWNELLQRLAELYGITLRFSDEERRQMTRAALAREVAASLSEHLRRNPNGVAGVYLRERRGITPDTVHFGELTKESIQAAKDSLHQRGISYDADDLRALGLRDDYAEQGYNCVIPYRVNGAVRGFILRNTRPDCSDKDRYRYSQGLGRGGYCDALTHGEPAVIVEGQFDAVRLIQAGVRNVIGIGGATIGEDIARLLKAHGITEVTYIPDLEYNPDGTKRTDLIEQAIKGFQTIRTDGEPVVSYLYVAELPKPADMFTNDKYKVYKNGVLDKYKTDADTFGKDNGAEALAAVPRDNTAAWAWELDNLITWAKTQDKEHGTVNVATFQRKFDDIYNRAGTNPYELQRLRDEIRGNAVFEAFGVTPQALNDKEARNNDVQYNNNIRDYSAALNKAIQEGASPERIGNIIRKLQDAQTMNTRDEWNAQLARPFSDELQAVEEQPETLKTKWEVGNVDKQGTYYKHDNIEFYPADIEVFCAPTSHGKTMILFQSVMDLISTTDKTYLYVSCEENKRQLFERALNVYIDIPATPDGMKHDRNGNPITGAYCFKEQTRKKTIKAVIRGDVPPFEYPTIVGRSEHYDALSTEIWRKIRQYERDVFPRLKLIHTDATIENICANISRTVEDYRRQGVDVGGVFVDYMQLLTTENRNYSRHDELKDICTALKDCAARTEVPIIIAAQLNREVFKGGIDTITVANIGEGADIERIAHDVYLVWQVDKTQESIYKKSNANGDIETNFGAFNVRSNRIYTRGGLGRGERELKAGYIYIERMKARDGKTEGWGLLPYDGERGFIGTIDTAKMAE